MENVSKENESPIETKMKILENELKIIEQSNLRFKEDNENLKSELNNLNNNISILNNEILQKKETINQFNTDTKELEFLKMNLYYGHKCRRSFFNTKGFSVGSDEYKKCVLSKGRKN